MAASTHNKDGSNPARLPSEFPAASVMLRDEASCLIRPVRSVDAAAFLILARAIHERGEGVVRTADELPQTVEEQAEQLRRYESGSRGGANGCLLVAELDGALVGYASARRFVPSMVRHAATVSLAVHPEYQGRGIGRALVERLIAWAKDGPGKGVSRLELFVFADHARAIALYESLGFVREGVHKGKIREPGGKVKDDVSMALVW